MRKGAGMCLSQRLPCVDYLGSYSLLLALRTLVRDSPQDECSSESSPGPQSLSMSHTQEWGMQWPDILHLRKQSSIKSVTNCAELASAEVISLSVFNFLYILEGSSSAMVNLKKLKKSAKSCSWKERQIHNNTLKISSNSMIKNCSRWILINFCYLENWN